MHPIKRFRLARWPMKVLMLGALALAVPATLFAFLVAVSWLRWEREREDLLANVKVFHQSIRDAESSREKVIGKRRAGGPAAPTRVYDRHGALIGEFMTEQTEVVPFREIPRLLVSAIVAMEDTEFRRHNGVNLKRVINAAVENVFGRRTMGGSTITQQLAKLLFTNRETTLQRKIFEFFGAKELESLYSKDEILLMYLNTVYFGHGAYGVEAASRLYFNKSVKMLNVYECALLAGILSRPEAYSPLTDVDAAKLKHLQALARMVHERYVDQSVLNRDFERFWEDLEKKLVSPSFSFWKMKVNRAPYFIEFLRQKLQKYFKDDEITSGGLSIYTTLDDAMQQNAQGAVVRGLRRVEEAKEKEIREWLSRNARELDSKLKKADEEQKKTLLAEWEKRKADYLREYQEPIEAALVSLDSANGYVLAMVGGRNYTFKNELNRAVYSQRQFGSAMKPIVYASALQHKTITAASRIRDERRTYMDHGKPWSPHNYDDVYLGDVSIRTALIRSLNTVAVETIVRLGPRKVADALEKAFFYKRGFPGIPSMPLGSIELTPLEAAQLYGVLASGGHRVKPLFIRRVADRNGKTLFDFESAQAGDRAEARGDGGAKLPDTLNFDDDNALLSKDTSLVMDPRAVFVATDMMRDVFSPAGTGYYARVVNNFFVNAAGKSGTSDNNRDNWFAGFVRNTVAVVWVGFDNDNTMLPKAMTGGVSAGPIWTDFMGKSFWGQGDYGFPRPDGVVERLLCRPSTRNATEGCTNTYREFFIEGTQPDDDCDLPHARGGRVPLRDRHEDDDQKSGEKKPADKKQGDKPQDDGKNP